MTTEKKKRKECEAEGCTIVPVFNYNNESSGRFCKAHRHAVELPSNLASGKGGCAVTTQAARWHLHALALGPNPLP